MWSFALVESLPSILVWIAKVVIVLIGLFFTIKYAVIAALRWFRNQ